MFADEECRDPKSGVDDHTKSNSFEEAKDEGGGESNADSGGAEEEGEIAPSLPGGWRP
jgi:hypothetical protein